MYLERINDHTFNFINKDNKVISISVHTKYDPEFRYNLAFKAAESFFQQPQCVSTKRFRLGHRNWKLQRKGKQHILLVFLAKIFNFFHPPGEDNIIRYKIGPSFFKGRKKKSASTELTLHKKNIKVLFKNPIERANFKYFLKRTNLSFSESIASNYKLGQRDVIKTNRRDLRLNSPTFFEDSFTKLATTAFQRLEKEFTSKDDFTPDHADYRIINEDGHLKLVHSSSSIDFKHAEAAKRLYINYLIMRFGADKISAIEHLCGFKLKEAAAITPEHVYRINVCLTDLDYRDVDHLLTKFNAAKPPSPRVKNLRRFLLNQGFTRFQAISVERFFKSYSSRHDPTKAFAKWLKGVQRLHLSSPKLNPALYNDLVSMTGFSQEERELALTGRKIFGFIRSGYSTADLGQYKPWVDQHQLTQFYPELINSLNLTSYYEKLAHVISKIHLTKEHPEDGLRLGALIPAPPLQKGGPTRWYQVTSCVSNGYGIFSFTLEAASEDQSLPAIKLYRSTASSRYALHSKSSLTNDFNNFNSPGYQGIGRTDSYEEEFVKKRTIPVWLGYALQAKEALNEARKASNKNKQQDYHLAYHSLQQANAALRSEIELNYPVKNFKQVLKDHDAILNELFFKYHSYLSSYKNGFPRIYQYLVSKYILKKKVKLKDPQNDAELLKGILLDIRADNHLPKHGFQIDALIHDIDHHLLSDEAIRQREKKQLELKQRKAFAYEKQASSHFTKKQLKFWLRDLNRLATERNELLEEKIDTGLVFCGHSLGGACAQSHLVHWLTNKERIPLPGSTCSAYVFDEPAINKRDNRRFIRWGAQHTSLFNNHDIKFEIIRRQEAGDIIVTAGEEHLGTVYSKEEEDQTKQWLRFDAAILKRHPQSTHFPIALPRTAHETRFLDGVKINTFYCRKELAQIQKKRKQQQVYLQSCLDLASSPLNRRQLRTFLKNIRCCLTIENQEKIIKRYRHVEKSVRRTFAQKKPISQNTIKFLEKEVGRFSKTQKEIAAHLSKPSDYYCTYYSPLIQGIFDREGIFKGQRKHEEKLRRKHFCYLKVKLWDLKFMDPTKAEKARKSVALFWTFIRKQLINTIDNYLLPDLFHDDLGNLAVHYQSGILSRPKHKDGSSLGF